MALPQSLADVEVLLRSNGPLTIVAVSFILFALLLLLTSLTTKPIKRTKDEKDDEEEEDEDIPEPKEDISKVDLDKGSICK
eukprot:g1328.t1